MWERRLARQGTSPVAAEVCCDRAEAGVGRDGSVVPGHVEGGLGLGLGLGHLGGVPDLGTPVLSAHRALSVGCLYVSASSPSPCPQSHPGVPASTSEALVSRLL